MLIIQLCTIYANFPTDLCALISLKLFGNSKKNKKKNSEKIEMRKTSQSAIKTQKYLLKKGTHSVVSNCHWPQIHMSN